LDEGENIPGVTYSQTKRLAYCDVIFPIASVRLIVLYNIIGRPLQGRMLFYGVLRSVERRLAVLKMTVVLVPVFGYRGEQTSATARKGEWSS